jgi:hypothetical protein
LAEWASIRVYESEPEELCVCYSPLEKFFVRLKEVLYARDLWNIGIIDAPIASFLEPGFQPRVRWFPRRQKRVYVADPFGLVHEGQRYLFCEKFDYKTYTGSLIAARLSPNNELEHPVRILSQDVHQSYPYIFKFEGKVYCMPEAARSGRVAAYQALELPHRWSTTIRILDDVALVDPTIFEYAGRWWLFGVDRDRDRHAALYAWYADNPFGPWKPHAGNPIKQDPGSSRPGGTPFTHKGVLYRPAQDCRRSYGAGLVINRIDVLTPHAFEEEPVRWLLPCAPGPCPHGVHTISSFGNQTLIDGKNTGFVAWALLGTFRKYFAKLARLAGWRREDSGDEQS